MRLNLPRGSLGRAALALAGTWVAAVSPTASAAVDFAPRITIRTDEQPTAVAIADVTGDGIADLLTGSAVSPELLLHTGLGGGAFASGAGIPTGDVVLAVATGDFDEDGDLDVATANLDRSLGILAMGPGGRVTATSTVAVGGGPSAIATGDVNGDGHLDLAVVNSESRNASVILGHGPAGFDRSRFTGIGDFPVDAGLADVTEDGRLDLVGVVQTPPGVSVAAGNGDGTFGRPVRLLAGDTPSAAAVADLDGDRHLDLIASNQLSNEVTLQLGLGAGRFVRGRSALTSSFPVDLAIDDWTGDGLLDVATVNSGSNDVSVLEGDGRGLLRPARQFQVGNAPGRIASGDVTGDGRPDLVISNGGGRTLSILPARPRLGAGTAKVRRPCPAARRRAISAIETRCVALAMSPAQVLELLGRPKRARVVEGGASLRWHYPRLLVRFSRRSNSVTSVRTLFPGARTAGGIAVGAVVGSLERLLDSEEAVCSRTGAVETCTVPSLFTLTQYRAVSGLVVWIQVVLATDLLSPS